MSTKRETENVKIEKAVPGGGGPGGGKPCGEKRIGNLGRARHNLVPRRDY